MRIPTDIDTPEGRNSESVDNLKKDHRGLLLIVDHEVNVMHSKLYVGNTCAVL